MIDIPIYRAKKIDSDEYAEGYLFKGWKSLNTWTDCIMFTERGDNVDIDSSTIAISFQDMIDSDGKRIFACLNEDGVGGDNIEYQGKQYISCFCDAIWTMILPKGSKSKMCYNSTFFAINEMKITGIQK